MFSLSTAADFCYTGKCTFPFGAVFDCFNYVDSSGCGKSVTKHGLIETVYTIGPYISKCASYIKDTGSQVVVFKTFYIMITI